MIRKYGYGCDQNHSMLNGFQKIENIVEKVCGNITVEGTCCRCGETKVKDFCEDCLK